jgi:hypothetical protein
MIGSTCLFSWHLRPPASIEPAGCTANSDPTYDPAPPSSLNPPGLVWRLRDARRSDPLTGPGTNEAVTERHLSIALWLIKTSQRGSQTGDLARSTDLE